MNPAGKTSIDMNKIKAEILFQCLCIALVISLSPLKIASYFFPFLLLIFLFFRLPSKTFYKKLLIVLLSFGATVLFYFLKAFFFKPQLQFGWRLLIPDNLWERRIGSCLSNV